MQPKSFTQSELYVPAVSVVDSVSGSPYSVQKELLLSIGFGLVSDITRVAAFGNIADIDTGTLPEDIWELGGLYPWLTSETALQLVSDNAQDASAGTGARTVLVSGLDSNYLPVTQLVTLNGTTPVNLVQNLYRINSMLIMSAGSSKVNLGTLNLRDTSGGTVRAIISPQVGIARQSIYTVPAGFTLQILSQYISLYGTGTARTADVATFFQLPTGFYRTPLTLTTGEGNPYRHDGIPGITLLEKTDFCHRCLSVSTNNTSISTAWLGVLRRNT